MKGKYAEESAFYSSKKGKQRLISWIVRTPKVRIGKLVKVCRACEYWKGRHSRLGNILYRLCERRLYRLGASMNLEIYPGCFAEGLRIYHYGVVVSNRAKIGKNCTLHGNNCIGNNGTDLAAPIIGNNVDIGFGAVIIGGVVIPDGTVIGANAVVCRSIEEDGHVVVGIPATIIK